MRFKLIIGLLSYMAIAANAAVTITFTSSAGALSNFNDGSGTSIDSVTPNNLNRLLYGILVDADGDGFDGLASAYDDGFSLVGNINGIALSLHTGTLTDDVLYMNSSRMTSQTDQINLPGVGEVLAYQNRLLSYTGLEYNAGLNVNAGDRIAIMWFDTNTTTPGTAASGLKYGIYQLPAVSYGSGNANVLPTDGATYIFAPAFAGADSAKTMGFQLGVIPEPSTFLLSSLGVLALLRRRR